MKIERRAVEQVAKLARLELPAEELDALTGQLDAILGYVAKLDELDTAAILPTAHAVPMENAFRSDQVTGSLGVDAALSNAPEYRDGCFQVPKVIE